MKKLLLLGFLSIGCGIDKEIFENTSCDAGIDTTPAIPECIDNGKGKIFTNCNNGTYMCWDYVGQIIASNCYFPNHGDPVICASTCNPQ